MTDGQSRFVYVAYIRTTPEQIWAALTTSDLIKKYWFGADFATDWKVGSPWKRIFPDGQVADSGAVVECEPPRRLVLTWRNERRPDLTAEGYARCSMAIEPVDGVVRLTLSQTMDRAGSVLIATMADGWPRIVSNLKSLLETGDVVLKHR